MGNKLENPRNNQNYDRREIDENVPKLGILCKMCWNTSLLIAHCSITVILINADYCFPFFEALFLTTINQISVKKNILTLPLTLIFFERKPRYKKLGAEQYLILLWEGISLFY